MTSTSEAERIESNSHPGWTGPKRERRSYFVPDRTRYESGGLGVVYRAKAVTTRFDLEQGTDVAVKIFTGDITDDRFEKLYQRGPSLSEVTHPHLAKFVEAFTGPPFIDGAVDEGDSTERLAVHVWVDGETLAERCRSASPVDILRWGNEAAEGLDHLHHHPAGPFAHRDIHPRNIVVSTTNSAVLIDFDTILVDDSAGTRTELFLAGTRFAPRDRAPGLDGAQRDDRWSLTKTVLHAFADDPEGQLATDEAGKIAMANLRGTAADPRGVVDRLLKILNGKDPQSARAIFHGLRWPMQHKRRLPRAPSPRHRRMAVVAAAILVPLLLAAGLVLTLSAPSVSAVSSVTYTFKPARYASGLVALRDWSLSGSEGQTLSGRLTLINSTFSRLHTTYEEVLPKSVAMRADKVRFSPRPSDIVQTDPVVQYDLKLDSGNSLVIRYNATIGPTTGAWSSRLSKLADEQTSAQTAYLKSVGKPIPATLDKIAIAPSTLLLQVGQQFGLHITGVMSDGTEASAAVLSGLAWASENPSVVSVSKGEVEGLATGKAPVTAHAGTTFSSVAVTVTGTSAGTGSVPGPHAGSGGQFSLPASGNPPGPSKPPISTIVPPGGPILGPPGSVVVPPQPGAVQHTSLSVPVRAAVFYPWYPNAWNQQGLDPFSHSEPSAGYYNSSDPTIISQQIAAMRYGHLDAALVSWWGQGSQEDQVMPSLLSAANGTGFKWAVYYEPEGYGDPSVAQISSDLTYISSKYASNPNYLYVNNRPVIFVYADANDGCGMVSRWFQANQALNPLSQFYVVLKVFPGYASCADQPDQWHQYGPTSAEDHQQGHSFMISPGYWKANESTPQLGRDVSRWDQELHDMVNSGEPVQLITTFNEWGEGTAVESGPAWPSSSGYGQYLDAMNTILPSP